MAENIEQIKDEVAQAKFKKNFKFLSKAKKAEVLAAIQAPAQPTVQETPVADPTPPPPPAPKVSKAQEDVNLPPAVKVTDTGMLPKPENPKVGKLVVRQDKFPPGAVIAIFACKDGHKTKAPVHSANVPCDICGGPTVMKNYYDAHGHTVMLPAGFQKVGA